MSEEKPESVEPEKKKRGRPRNENYLSWLDAREYMRSEMLPSRGKFFEWWERNKPKAIPRFPYRVYKEWTNWNDFLGTNNKFNERIGRSWRPLDEATLFVHKLQIKTQSDWMEWCKIEDNLPEDIPARPDVVYNKWISWNHWLGNKPVQAIEAQQQAQKSAVYYIIHEDGVPGNVFTFGVESAGLSAMKHRWDKDKFTIVKMFWYDSNKGNTVKQIIDAFSSSYLGDDRQRITPNVHEIVWHLQVHLDTITPKEINVYATNRSPLSGTTPLDQS